MAKQTTLNIRSAPGYLLCEPYLSKKSTFTINKENAGEDKLSTVLQIGPDVEDSNGILRTSNCKPGDIIIHADSNKTFTIDFRSLRFVHFSEIHGIYKNK